MVRKPAAACPVLVERDRELALLSRVANDVVGGVSQLVLVSGESGAGKSRLLADFVASMEPRWRTVSASGSSSRRPFADVIAAAAVTGERPELEIGTALAASLRSSPGQPVVVIVDDAEQLDVAMIRAIGIAVELLDDEPVLILLAFRVGHETAHRPTATAAAELLRSPRAVSLQVGPLSRVGVGEMARAFGQVPDTHVLDDVLRRSGGNAFFVEELLTAPEAGLSWTVTETVLRRVQSAGAAGTQVAEYLSLAAGPLGASIAHDLDPDGGPGVLTLVEAGIAVQSDAGEVRLRHALVGEVLRGQLTLTDRRRLHAGLAERLESEPDPPAEEIAHHWLDAGDRSRAARWAAIAADDETTMRGYMTASDLYEIALDIPPADPLEHAKLLDRAAGAAAWAGVADLALARATTADRLYREAGEAWRAAAMWLSPRLQKLPKPATDPVEGGHRDVSSLLLASEQASRDRDHARATSIARDALQLCASGAYEQMWTVEAAYRLCRAGQVAEGEEVLHRLLSTSMLSEKWTVASECVGRLSEVALARGDIDKCLDYHRQGLAMREHIGLASWGLEVGVSLLHAARGELEQAQRYADQVLASNLPMAVEFVQLPLTWIDLELNQLERVAERINRMAVVRTLGVASYTIGVLYIDARRRHRVGDDAAACRLLDEADELCGDLFEPGRPDRLLLRARLAARFDDRSTMSSVHSQLVELVERGGCGLISAAVDWAAGLWERSSGRVEEARRRLRSAAERLEQASRYPFAAEAWCELAELDTTSGRDTALARAQQICDERGLIAIAARIAEIAGRPSTIEVPVPPAFVALTPRQREIATLVAQGRSNREIADQLFLSVNTVRNQLVAVFDILGVSRRSEIAALAAKA